MNKMKEHIQVRFDERISGYVISMPEFICLNAIEQWIDEFGKELSTLPQGSRIALLIDTNLHQFESIQCLKRMREFLTTNKQVMSASHVVVAFVAPASYIEVHIKSESESEAYFETRPDAYRWLEGMNG